MVLSATLGGQAPFPICPAMHPRGPSGKGRFFSRPPRTAALQKGGAILMSEEEFVFALATLLVAVILATFQITWEIAKAVFRKDDPRTDRIPHRKKKK